MSYSNSQRRDSETHANAASFSASATHRSQVIFSLISQSFKPLLFLVRITSALQLRPACVSKSPPPFVLVKLVV